MLIALRFVTGIGLGGALLPNATALMAEFAPPKVRGQAITAAIVGIPLGGMLGAAIAAKVVPEFGWSTMFIVGGLLPLITALAYIGMLVAGQITVSIATALGLTVVGILMLRRHIPRPLADASVPVGSRG